MTPFTVAWAQSEFDDLRRRLAAADLAPAPAGSGWSLGCDADFLARFRDYWIEEYDFAAAVASLNRYPQFVAEVDGLPIHFVHVKGQGRESRPLLMTHGWPGSHFEFWGVVDRLARDGFDLVLPSLPGYAFSGKPSQPLGPRATARLWDKLMRDVLGYPSYLAQGGDWGSIVTAQLGLNHEEAVRGIHLNMVALRSAMPPQNPAEAEWARKSAAAYQMLSGYSMVQMMKPMSLAALGAGNPLGQAAWILERFHDWADLSQGDLESVFGLEHLVTNIMLYVMTGSFSSSLLFYNGLVGEGPLDLPEGKKCAVPVGIAAFPGDALLPVPPRSRVELVASDLMHWTDMPGGGHFAAMEKPDLFACDVAAWADKVWPGR